MEGADLNFTDDEDAENPYILTLPVEILREISFYLKLQDLISLRSCNARLAQLFPVNEVKKRRKEVDLAYLETNFDRLVTGDLRCPCPDLVFQFSKQDSNFELLKILRHRVVSLPSVDIFELQDITSKEIIEFPNLEFFSYSNIVYKKPFLGVKYPYYSKEKKYVMVSVLGQFLKPCENVLTTLSLENIDLSSLVDCKFSNLRTLTLYRCSNTARLIDLLSGCSETLEVLNFKDNNRIDWNEFGNNIRELQLSKLRKLHLSLSEIAYIYFQFDDPDANKLPQNIFKLCPYVEELYLSGFTLHKVAVCELPCLKSLTMVRCQVYEKLTDLVAASSETLEILTLDNCSRAVNLANESTSYRSRREANVIETFKIIDDNRLDEDTTKKLEIVLSQSSSTLRYLMISLPKIPLLDVRFKALKSLELQETAEKTSDSAIFDLVRNNAPTLQTLKIEVDEVLEPKLMTIEFPNLKTFNSLDSVPISQFLTRISPTLEHLSVSSLQNFEQEEDLQLPKLLKLEVMKQNGLKSFFKKCCLTLQEVIIYEKNSEFFKELDCDLPTLQKWVSGPSFREPSKEELEHFKKRCPNASWMKLSDDRDSKSGSF